MSRLIDADALMRRFMDKPPEYYHASYIVGEINTAPTIDAVPVVRCCECKYYGEMLPNADNRMICHKFALNFDNDFFCRDGERRDDE